LIIATYNWSTVLLFAIETGHQSGPNNGGLQEARGEFIAYFWETMISG